MFKSKGVSFVIVSALLRVPTAEAYGTDCYNKFKACVKNCEYFYPDIDHNADYARCLRGCAETKADCDTDQSGLGSGSKERPKVPGPKVQPKVHPGGVETPNAGPTLHMQP